MSKMHELLAVENDVLGLANKVIDESSNTFRNKASEFYMGQNKTYKPNVDNDTDLVPPVNKEIIDTVISKLKYTFSKVAAEYDLLLQKEATNQKAVADLVIDGKVVSTDVPVNFLLTLERRLEKIRTLVAEAPTLPNGPKWIPAPQLGEGYYQLEKAQITYRTKNDVEFVIAHPATKEHRAEIKEVKKVTTIGQYDEMLYDSRMTSHDKAVILERVDTIIKEVRKSVRRANQLDVVERAIGSKVFEYVLTGNLA